MASLGSQGRIQRDLMASVIRSRLKKLHAFVAGKCRIQNQEIHQGLLDNDGLDLEASLIEVLPGDAGLGRCCCQSDALDPAAFVPVRTQSLTDVELRERGM